MESELASIFGSFIVIVFIVFVLGSPDGWFVAWLESRERLKRDELRTRRVEAFVKLSGAEQRLLVETMPDWLDPNDPADVESWKKARAEISHERE